MSRSPRESGEVEQGEVQQCIPCEGVADAPIAWVGAVLGEAQDVGRGLGAGKLAEERGDASEDHHDAEPDPVACAASPVEKAEGERAGREEENPDPDWPVSGPIAGGVAVAHFALVRVFDSNGDGHGSPGNYMRAAYLAVSPASRSTGVNRTSSASATTCT